MLFKPPKSGSHASRCVFLKSEYTVIVVRFIDEVDFNVVVSLLAILIERLKFVQSCKCEMVYNATALV